MSENPTLRERAQDALKVKRAEDTAAMAETKKQGLDACLRELEQVLRVHRTDCSLVTLDVAGDALWFNFEVEGIPVEVCYEHVFEGSDGPGRMPFSVCTIYYAGRTIHSLWELGAAIEQLELRMIGAGARLGVR